MKRNYSHLMLSASMIAMTLSACAPSASSDDLYLLVGSYNGADTESVQVYSFDQQEGRWTYVSGAKGVDNPTFLCVNEAQDRLYAVGELDADEAATMNAFSFDKETGSLQLLSTQMNGGGAPCNITLSPDEDYLLSANYCGGSVSIYQLSADGLLDTAPSIIKYEGAGFNPARQEQSHVHAVNFTPDQKYLLANDLGLDCIHVYPVDQTRSAGRLLLEDQRYDVKVDDGAGPRHLCFAPDGKHAYLITELSGQIFTLAYEAGQLKVTDAIVADTLQGGGSADIHITKDGQFVYASHRLKGDGISIYRVSGEDGRLERIGYQPTGIHPRNFALSPNEKYLLVACRDSNEIQVFVRDEQTGLLAPAGKNISMSKPMFVKFLSR